MNFKKGVSFFLLSFLIFGPGGYAEVSPDTARTASQWSDGWYAGASGYDEGVEEYKRTGKPMVVYMSVGWCPYCRRFEKEVLSSPIVTNFMKDMIRVNLNPESGKRENAIAFQYGIRGFPSFFLHPPQPGRAMQLYTGASPREFVRLCKRALQ